MFQDLIENVKSFCSQIGVGINNIFNSLTGKNDVGKHSVTCVTCGWNSGYVASELAEFRYSEHSNHMHPREVAEWNREFDEWGIPL